MEEKILIIGNGFDLYHRLPTRYKDFMFFADSWNSFYVPYMNSENRIGERKQIKVPLTKDGSMTHEALNKFGEHAFLFDEKHVAFLQEHLKTNTWINCFRRIDYKDIKWIDFEKEIENVLYDTEEYTMTILPQKVGQIAIDGLPESLSRIPVIFGDAARNEYVNFSEVPVLEDYVDKHMLQSQKELLIQFMLHELDDLIQCLQYYLDDFVSNIQIDCFSEQIRDLGEVNVLNFNYTNTFKTIYRSGSIREQHAVHGGITNSDIVLGISDDAFPDTYDYIRFQKYFQRIQKRTGSFYKEWLKPIAADRYGNALPKHVYIFGHSLGLADLGILNDFYNNETIKKITIYYHSQASYDDIVINLVKALKKETVIEWIGNGRIELIQLKPAVCSE